MAVTQTFNKVSYIGNDAARDFDLATKVFATSEVSVFLKTIATGDVATLVEGVDYTIAAISGDLNNGVRVTSPIAPDPVYSSDYQITIERIVEETQDLDLEPGGDLPANELEDALDRGVMISQQLSDRLSRSVEFPATDAAGVTYTVSSDTDRAGKALGFSINGSITELDMAAAGGEFTAVDTNAGLTASAGTISGKVDDVSLEFDGDGNFSIKDGGVETAHLDDNAVTPAKMGGNAPQTVIGRTTAGTGNAEEVPIVGDDAEAILINDPDFFDDSETTGATQKAIKDYIAANIGLVQRVHNQTQTLQDYSAGSSTIPFDNTKPQNTEGYEVLTQAITPTNASNILYIEAGVNICTTGTHPVVALFQDSGADCIACSHLEYQANDSDTIILRFRMVAGTTSSTTFKIRAGADNAKVVINGKWNGSTVSSIYDGTLISWLTITELKA